MKILITGGGTGGHLFPALALAKELLKRGHRVIYVGAQGRLEQFEVPDIIKESYFLALKSTKNLVFFAWTQWQGWKKIRTILIHEKPSLVIGFGGFISVPGVVAARLLHIPTIIHEQNVIPGRANRFLAPYVQAIAISFKETSSYFSKKKVYWTGNPRSSECRNYLVKSKSINRRILIVMGSLGSKTISQLLLEFIKVKSGPYEVKIITGKKHFPLFEGIQLIDKKIEIQAFSNNLLKDIQQADLVVTRAGATTLAELASLGTPALLIPSPYVRENHQMINATLFEQHGAAKIILESEVTPNRLDSEILDLVNQPLRLSQMRLQMNRLAHPDAVNECIKLIRRTVETSEY